MSDRKSSAPCKGPLSWQKDVNDIKDLKLGTPTRNDSTATTSQSFSSGESAWQTPEESPNRLYLMARLEPPMSETAPYAVAPTSLSHLTQRRSACLAHEPKRSPGNVDTARNAAKSDDQPPHASAEPGPLVREHSAIDEAVSGPPDDLLWSPSMKLKQKTRPYILSLPTLAHAVSLRKKERDVIEGTKQSSEEQDSPSKDIVKVPFDGGSPESFEKISIGGRSMGTTQVDDQDDLDQTPTSSQERTVTMAKLSVLVGNAYTVIQECALTSLVEKGNNDPSEAEIYFRMMKSVRSLEKDKDVRQNIVRSLRTRLEEDHEAMVLVDDEEDSAAIALKTLEAQVLVARKSTRPCSLMFLA